jgi:thiol-disulfide isomerase/thioredoxin
MIKLHFFTFTKQLLKNRTMKKTLSTLVLMLGLFFAASAQSYENQFIKIGQQAPELAFPSPQGKAMKLSEINKGRYVILDFWASWCGPCRGANPGLVKMYNEYTQKKFKGAKKGFTVVSCSLDKNADAWKAAIQKDGLLWEYHMSDLKQWESDAARLYGLQYIPQCFLLGPDGKIIGKYSRAEEAKQDLDKFLQ